MCLAIPALIVGLDENDNMATVDVMGLTRQASLRLTPQAKAGDYVLVHAGFAIEVIDEASAKETLDLINEFPELAGEGIPAGSVAASSGV